MMDELRLYGWREEERRGVDGPGEGGADAEVDLHARVDGLGLVSARMMHVIGWMG